jgi:hypothetical protein
VKVQKAPLSMVRGILKREWPVLPPDIIEVAIPDVVVATVIFFLTAYSNEKCSVQISLSGAPSHP